MRHHPQPARGDALHALAESENPLASRLWLRQQLRDRETAESIFRHMHREELLRLHLPPSGWWTLNKWTLNKWNQSKSAMSKVLAITAIVLVAAVAAAAITLGRLRSAPAAPVEQAPPPCVPCAAP